eukprot:Em0006g14a
MDYVLATILALMVSLLASHEGLLECQVFLKYPCYNISVGNGTSTLATTSTNATIGDLIDGTNYTVSVTAINCAGSSNSNSVSVQTCEVVFSVNVTTVLYQNNSVYDVELFWTHRQQSCSVPQYTVMVTSATSTDMSAVNVSYCTSSSCSYVQSISGANVFQPLYSKLVSPIPSSSSGFSWVWVPVLYQWTKCQCLLQGLTSGQMYYCKAAATNTNSNNCAGPVVGGCEGFLQFHFKLQHITLIFCIKISDKLQCQHWHQA